MPSRSEPGESNKLDTRLRTRLLSMSDEFEYLSPREFQKLSKAAKDRYLNALHAHLHTEYRSSLEAGKAEDDPQGQGGE
jgi:hypothetical protein